MCRKSIPLEYHDFYPHFLVNQVLSLNISQLFTEVDVTSEIFTEPQLKQRDKYPPLATDTEVNSCFSIY